MKSFGKVMSLVILIITLICFVGCVNEQKNIDEIERNDATKEYETYGIKKLSSYNELKDIYKKKFTDRLYEYYNGIFGPQFAEDAQQVPGATSDKSEDTSSTNTQVKGVDEDDVVKNNGRFIFAINSMNYYGTNGFIIYDTETNQLKRIEEKGFCATSLYLRDNYLVVMGKKYEINEVNKEVENVPYYWYRYDKETTVVKVYELGSSFDDINEIRSLEFDYSTVSSSRMINNNLYLVLTCYNIYDYANEEAIPFTYRDSILEGVQTLPSSNVFFLGDKETVHYNYSVLVGVDIKDDDPIDINAYFGYFENLYASLDGFYVAHTYYSFNNKSAYHYINYTQKTFIYRFKYDDEKLVYNGFNYADGYLKDQFSMNEYNGYFYVVTTLTNSESKSESFIHSYNVGNDDQFEYVSSVGKIGIDERIYSVNFEEDRAYAVTFRTIDPLYVIDISNPKEMTILGELKIPGVSDYLHTINDELQLGIGRDTEINSYGNAVSVGLKISLFDVSDEENPKELINLKFKDVHTDIAYDHKTLLTLPSKNIFGLPIESGYWRNNNAFNSGILIFKVDEDNKTLVELGFVSHQDSDNTDYDYEDYYNTRIIRGVIIKGKLYSISSKYITCNELDDNLTCINKVSASPTLK